MIKDVNEWLKSSPEQEEIVEIQDGPNKVKIIPQKIIETLLDELTEQNWSTRNFQFSSVKRKPNYIPNGTVVPAEEVMMCDASLELVVTYKVVVPISPYEQYDQQPRGSQTQKEIQITRVLVGAVSFPCDFFGNDHVANTAKSLCISNAASDLGRRFGKDLNPSVAPPINSLLPSGNKILQTLQKVNQ